MRRVIRSALDPGVFGPAALTPGGTPDRLRTPWGQRGLEIVSSPKVLGELTKYMEPDPSAHPPVVTPTRLLAHLGDVAPAASSARSRQRSPALAAWRVRRQRDVHTRVPGQGRTV